MTYGAYLRLCRQIAGRGKVNKTDFSKQLGMSDPEHYIGAENDKPGRKPSVDLLERAAQAAGFEFTDFIQRPGKKRGLTAKKRQLVNTLELLLALNDPEVDVIFEGMIVTFGKEYLQKR